MFPRESCCRKAGGRVADLEASDTHTSPGHLLSVQGAGVESACSVVDLGGASWSLEVDSVPWRLQMIGLVRALSILLPCPRVSSCPRPMVCPLHSGP